MPLDNIVMSPSAYLNSTNPSSWHIPLRNIFRQHEIIRNRRIGQHVIDAAFGAAAAVGFDEQFDLFEVGVADVGRVDLEAFARLEVLEGSQVLEGEVEFRLVEDVEDENLMAAVAEMV